MTPRRRDANQRAIAAALKDAGCSVFDTASLGEGFPDLVAVRPDGRVFLVEVKSPGGRLTAPEVQFCISAVTPAYRIFTAAQQAVEAVVDGSLECLYLPPQCPRNGAA